MKTLIDKDGIEWHYDDDLFLGEENIKLFPCYFAEYFPATVDPDDDLMSVCACHMVGFRTKNNPGDVCKGDPRKCPMVERKTSRYDHNDENMKELIEGMRKEHAFITSNTYWGETRHFRAGYLFCLQHIIEKAESYVGDVLK